MNTSDQNVFPLDTAFKRRWEKERVEPNWREESIADLYVPFTDITWGTFAKVVNSVMVSNSKDGIITQDKNLGPYFVSRDMLVEIPYLKENADDYSNDENKLKLIRFTNNVIDYLFTDVTKFNHSVLFSVSSYDDIYHSVQEITQKDIDYETARSYLNFFAEKVKIALSISNEADRNEKNQ